MDGSENSKYMIGQRSKSVQNSCIKDTRVVMNFMKDNGRQMKDTKGLTIVSGVTSTTTLHVILTVSSLTRIILTADNVILDVLPAGALLNSIAFLVQLMVPLPLIMKEEQYALLNVGMEFNLLLTNMTSMSVMTATIEGIS